MNPCRKARRADQTLLGRTKGTGTVQLGGHWNPAQTVQSNNPGASGTPTPGQPSAALPPPAVAIALSVQGKPVADYQVYDCYSLNVSPQPNSYVKPNPQGIRRWSLREEITSSGRSLRNALRALIKAPRKLPAPFCHVAHYKQSGIRRGGSLDHAGPLGSHFRPPEP